MRAPLLTLALLASAASAQVPAPGQPMPQPLPLPTAIEAPRDIPYPGTIRLSVDATDLDRKIFRVHERLPVSAGKLTLLYPRWLPGNHSPSGPIHLLAGLTVTAEGKRLDWVRDTVDVTAFHIDVPAGVSTIDLDFQFVSPTVTTQGRVVMTPAMLNLQWNAMALYPAGYFTRGIMVEASVKLPGGWKFGTALEPASTRGDTTTFKPVSFETLVDSPVFAGRYFRQIDLDPGARVPVRLDIVADTEDALDAGPAQIAAHRALVQQAYKLYGSHHYDRYDMLLALTGEMSGIGLEHHRSSENGTIPDYFTEWDKKFASRDLLAHEYTHSWNGKFRRGADLWTPNFNVPMRDSLLWVYEGQTQYWGYVLAARSGLWTKGQALEAIATVAATYDARVGRAWKPLIDTTNDPITSSRRPVPWLSWQRSEDYYSEGQLIWLDVDTRLREMSGGRKSLDDFARAFFGVDNGSYVVRTYDFDEVARTLNAVQPYDWAGFLKEKLEGHASGAPLDGLARGGYRLVYTDKPTDYGKSVEAVRKNVNLTFSLGLGLDKEGALTEVIWDSPGFKAGLTVGTKIVAVAGRAYDADGLRRAVADASDGPPVELLVRNGDRFRTVRIDYKGGLRYPRLERIAGTPARLDMILAPRS